MPDDDVIFVKEVINLTRDDDDVVILDDVVDIVAGPQTHRVRRDALQHRISAEAFDTAVIDLTMEDEDEVVPEEFWKKEIAARALKLQRENISTTLVDVYKTHVQQAFRKNAPVTRSHLQQLVVSPRSCYYAFTDNIEYRHISELFEPEENAADHKIEEESYEDDGWPPRRGYHALFTLDCFEAGYFLQVLLHHAKSFEMLFGSTLTADKIKARNALLADLLADESKSWIIRILVGSEHVRYRRYHGVFRELTWRKIWIPKPPAVFERDLWSELVAKASDTHDVYIAPDLFSGSVADFELTLDETITAQEIAYLEEVFSLNHIPDAPLPPAVPVPGMPTEPLNGFEIATGKDPYWTEALPADLATTIPADHIRATKTGYAVNVTTGEPFTIHYLKKNFLLLEGKSGAMHTCLFLPDRVDVRRAFPFEQYAQNETWQQRLQPGIIEAGSLLSDERIVFIGDLKTKAVFIGRRLPGKLGYFFIAVEHSAYVKKQPS